MDVFAVLDIEAYQGEQTVALFSTYEKAKAFVERRYDMSEYKYDGENAWLYFGNESSRIEIASVTIDEKDEK
jgi:hypothetical protein